MGLFKPKFSLKKNPAAPLFKKLQNSPFSPQIFGYWSPALSRWLRRTATASNGRRSPRSAFEAPSRWQRISDPECIADVLRQVYADHSLNVDNVFHCILETTQHPAAAASFASIMFAPQAELSFSEALSRCDMNGVPICLMYGKEDPWVKPVWGLEVKKHVPEAPYYEISPAGHCPHDEVPEVVNYLLRGWIKSLESQGAAALPLLDDMQSENIQSSIAKDLEFVRQGSNQSVIVRFMGSSFSLWSRMESYFTSRFAKLETKWQ